MFSYHVVNCVKSIAKANRERTNKRRSRIEEGSQSTEPATHSVSTILQEERQQLKIAINKTIVRESYDHKPFTEYQIEL